jgi:hypothetical protein
MALPLFAVRQFIDCLSAGGKPFRRAQFRVPAPPREFKLLVDLPF